MEAWRSDKAATCERAGISVDSEFVEETTPYVSFVTRNVRLNHSSFMRGREDPLLFHNPFIPCVFPSV